LHRREITPQAGQSEQGPHCGGNPFRTLSIPQVHARYPRPAIVTSEIFSAVLAPADLVVNLIVENLTPWQLQITESVNSLAEDTTFDEMDTIFILLKKKGMLIKC